MLIVINRQDLLTVLKRAGAAVNSSSMLSIEKCVLIVASDGSDPSEPRLTFGATAGPLSTIVKTQAGEVKKAGRAVLSHKDLQQRIDQMPPGLIELSVDEKFKVVIKSGSSKRRSTMMGLDPAEFPAVLSERPGEAMYSVEAKILQQAASETAFAVSEDMTRGMLLVPGDDKLFQLISLGRYALAVATGWFVERNGGASERPCLLPKNLLDAIASVPKEDACSISMDDKKIFVETHDSLILATQLQTQLPDVWRQILKSAPVQKRFRVSSDAFLSSVKAVSVASDFVEGSERFVQIDIVAEEGQVTVRTKKSEKSEGEDELAVSEASAGNFIFHVDAGMLSGALRAFSPAELDLYFDVIGGQEALVLKNETLFAMLQLIADIPAPPAKEKK